MICPTGAQRPEDVPLWSYFGQNVADHKRIKLGCIRFLTNFDSIMSDIQLLELGKTENSLKTHFMDYG